MKPVMDFTSVALNKSLDDAVKLQGDAITAGEYAALKQLSPADLQALLTINKKINDIRKGGLAEADWTCVNVVC